MPIAIAIGVAAAFLALGLLLIRRTVRWGRERRRSCPDCAYDLEALCAADLAPTCPECGRTARRPRDLRRRIRHRGRFAIGVALLALAGIAAWCAPDPPNRLLRIVPDAVLVRLVLHLPPAWYATGTRLYERLVQEPMSVGAISALAESVAALDESGSKDAPDAVELLGLVLIHHSINLRPSTSPATMTFSRRTGLLWSVVWIDLVYLPISAHARGVLLNDIAGVQIPLRAELLDELRAIPGFADAAAKRASAGRTVSRTPDATLCFWRLRAAREYQPEESNRMMRSMFTADSSAMRQAVCEEILRDPTSYPWTLDLVEKLARNDPDEYVRQVAYEAEKRMKPRSG